MTQLPHPSWGRPPWAPPATVPAQAPPEHVDVAIVGGGFTGLAAACRIARLEPGISVAVLEAGRIGGGASGRTGSIVMDATAAGPLPGLGGVLEGLEQGLAELEIDCGYEPIGVWEIAREEAEDSPVSWRDTGDVGVVGEEPGGTLDPARLLDGLARAALAAGVNICENRPVRRIRFETPPVLELEEGGVRADRVLLAVNGSGRGLDPWPATAGAMFTVAVATAPLDDAQRRALCRGPLKPFYTSDLPYLWGRPLSGGGVIFGAGLVYVDSQEHLAAVDVGGGEAGRLIGKLEERARGLAPGLESLEFAHRWGGPILFTSTMRPVFCRHPGSDRVLFLGGYTGHGVALPLHLARWAAESLLRDRPLPDWGIPEEE